MSHANTTENLISLPKGGGALSGLGEKFSPDLFTGTGNITVPLTILPGRTGFQPGLNLTYSTGTGNGTFGLGWSLNIPEIRRKTSAGVPQYNDAAAGPATAGRRDVFILSGAEDLVPITGSYPGIVRYRPRTEGLFATIERHLSTRDDYWIVQAKSGITSTYGKPASDAGTPAIITKPDSDDVFAWMIRESRDPFGNLIRYDYDRDSGAGDGHQWNQPLLRSIRYVDFGNPADGRFLIHVEFEYEDRPDPFSDYRANFEIRSTKRCRAVKVSTHTAEGMMRDFREYVFTYQNGTYNGVSLLCKIDTICYDDDGNAYRDEAPGTAHPRQLPPLTFGYTPFAPERRKFESVSGPDLPMGSLGEPDMALVDLHGGGLPDLLKMNGTVRYWRNLGGGRFDWARWMDDAPPLALGDTGVQMIDANGDGRTDLLVTRAPLNGFYSLTHSATWHRNSFQRYDTPPSFDLADPEVRLIDLDGDGYTDALRSGTRMECFFNDPDPRIAWTRSRAVLRQRLDAFPNVNFSDPRVKLADITGDGLQDIVLVHDGSIEYWPNLGGGDWGNRLRMHHAPRFSYGYDPQRILMGDVDGDGLDDIVYVDDDKVLLWINQGGNGWSDDPIVISGTPPTTNVTDVRLVDLHGNGGSGVLWSSDAGGNGEHMMFLDFTGGLKPYLLNEMDNYRGAVTRVQYRPSTHFYLADLKSPSTRWRTPLPFPVHVVSRLEVADEISRGKLTTEFRYRHGYWDGTEREFRGFGMVEQVDSESFESYYQVEPHGNSTRLLPVQKKHFSPPTLTRTWFHLGPVGEEFGDWAERDYADEYWSGDPPLLSHQDWVNTFLARYNDRSTGSPSHRVRRIKRDALRVLRGCILRTELYALDGDARKIGGEELHRRPYTVAEHSYQLREVDAPGDDSDRKRIFVVHPFARRTTQWERADDPMTQFAFTGDYDDFGQARRQTNVAMPRTVRNQRTAGAVIGVVNPNETRVLATHTRTTFASATASGIIHDRVAQVKTYELANQPLGPDDQNGDAPTALREQWIASQKVWDLFDALAASDVILIGHELNHYDGPEFEGLPMGRLGPHGALTRSETLVFTESILSSLDNDTDKRRPHYLGGTAALPSDAPAGLVARTGYRPAATISAGYEPGYYADTLRRRHSSRGLVTATQDAHGLETTIEHDEHDLLPTKVRDPVGLETIGAYNYRVLQPESVTEPNGNSTNMRYNPAGLPHKQFVAGTDAAGNTIFGGTEAKPEFGYSYDFLSFARHRDSDSGELHPVFVHTTRRVHHACEGTSDETIESRDYSDGFGRLLQTRAEAESHTFGTDGSEVGLRAEHGDATAPAIGTYAANRVVVSGWQTFDNKGKPVEKYEPFFSEGWEYRPKGTLTGTYVTLYYDPRGQLIRTTNPDGSEQRIIFGWPTDPLVLHIDINDTGAVPVRFVPSPWERYIYDANDLAEISRAPEGALLSDRAPRDHHFTPVSVVLDALGRSVSTIARKGTSPGQDWFLTRSTFDVRGNILAETDALGRTAFQYHYDLLDRPLVVDSIDSGRRSSVLDALGNVIEFRDSKGSLTLRSYDELGRLRQLWARNDSAGRFTLRQRLEYGDDGSHALSRSRNTLGRCTKHYDEAGVLEVSEYDFKGNVLEKSRRTIRDDDLASGWLADWNAAAAESGLEYTAYHASARYDALDRVIEIVYPQDVEGKRRKLRPRYNRAGAFESVALDNAPFVGYIAYNARGQRVLIAYGNDVVTRYAYDSQTFRLARLRTDGIQSAGPIAGTEPDSMQFNPVGSPLQDFAYTYDLTGNMTTVDERTPGCGFVNGPGGRGRDQLVRQFGYDPVYRLISASGRACVNIDRPRGSDDDPRCVFYAGGAPSPTQANLPDLTEEYTERFSYDPAGNMLELKYQAASGTWKRRFGMAELPSDRWEDARNNRLTSMRDGGADHSYEVDAGGNLIRQNSERHYSWNHADQMTSYRVQAGVTGPPSLEARYLYGSDGMRVKKWVRNQQQQVSTTVFVDGIFEHHRRQTATVESENNTLHVMDNNRRISLVRIGAPVDARDASPPVQYCLEDHLGSSHIILGGGTTMSSSFINREEYFPFGETSCGSFAIKRYRYRGKERDEESGLHYFGARYLMSPTARWISADPVGPRDSVNLFQYAQNNPVRFADGKGTDSVDITNPVRPDPIFPGALQADQLPSKTKDSYKILHQTNFESVIVNGPFGKEYQRRVPAPREGLDKTAAQRNLLTECVPTTIRNYLRVVLKYDFETEGIKKLIDIRHGRPILWNTDDRERFKREPTGDLGIQVLNDLLPDWGFFLDNRTYPGTSEADFLSLARAVEGKMPVIVQLEAHFYMLEGVETVDGRNIYKIRDPARPDATRVEFRDVAYQGKFIGWERGWYKDLIDSIENANLRPPQHEDLTKDSLDSAKR